ncbi:cytokinin hydroxylase-like isoform X2 [Spinacia oleracea]|uniref:Cytokinin hydroxylase-like isoform X2 n=1 Tax=Spinacia oleracea TaxID=3562 RepID=A0ABM3RFA9_SPIOL|nr:cytokinin hydroxylase-like isoform X2 [Spinacia oleracea]
MSLVHFVYGFIFISLFLLWKLINACYISPVRTLRKLRSNGLGGPTPSFPLGNLSDMKQMLIKAKSLSSSSLLSSSSESISHDIHSSSLPYFAQWKKLHGKVYVYWMGVEPFVYIADPEFLKEMSGKVFSRNWGKPNVFRSDRVPMLGECGLSMIEGNAWARHRHIITPAFSSTNLKGMVDSMVESTIKMIKNWSTLLGNSSKLELELDVEREFPVLGGETMAKTNFGIHNSEVENTLLEKLREIQISLFKHTRYVGVPYGKFLSMRQTLKARKLGKEIDGILLSIINARREIIGVEPRQHEDLLRLLLEGEDHFDGQLTTKELIDECKTFFFGGHETVALSMTWTSMLLAMYPKWQDELREEIKEVIGDKDDIDFTMLARLKKIFTVTICTNSDAIFNYKYIQFCM